MAYMKYIKDSHGNFVIFSQTMKHKDVAKALGMEPTAAGSVAMLDDKIHTSGESVSLFKRSDPKDGDKIKRQLDFYDGA